MKGSAEVKIVWRTYVGGKISGYQSFCDDMPCKKGEKKISNAKFSALNHDSYHSTRCRMAAFQSGSVGILDRPIIKLLNPNVP